jgi:biopolymer transport protein ExbD
MASHGEPDGDEPEFQIAPMIDVLLVLLVFFMSITTLQVARVDRSVNLPVASHATPPGATPDESVINIRWDAGQQRAEFNFENTSYASPEPLTPILAQRRAASPRHRVVLRGDRLVPAGQVSRALAAASRAGITEITFAALVR